MVDAHLEPGLGLVFLLLAAGCLLALLISHRAGERARRRTGRGLSVPRLIGNFVLGIGLCLGMAGLIALSGTVLYDAIGGRTFLGEEERFGAEAFVGLVAFVIGVPVALAGSFYAVLLAYQSVEFSRKERVDRQLAEWDAEILAITTNFARLHRALQRMNALATSDMEQVLHKLVGVGKAAAALKDGEDASDDRGRRTFDEAIAAFEAHDSTQGLRDSLFEVGESLQAIRAHQRSCDMLEYLLARRTPDPGVGAGAGAGAGAEGGPAMRPLLATQLLAMAATDAGAHDPARDAASLVRDHLEIQPEYLAYLQYGNPARAPLERVDALMEALGALEVQAHRVTPRDVHAMAVQLPLLIAAGDIRQGIAPSVPLGGNLDGYFYGEWLSAPARKREPEYFIWFWLRLICDAGVTCETAHQAKTRRVLGIAETVLADLHLLIPDRTELVRYFEANRHHPRWDELGDAVLARRIADLDYAGSGVSPMARAWLDKLAKPETGPLDWKLLRQEMELSPAEFQRLLRTGNDAYLQRWAELMVQHCRTILAGDIWAWAAHGPEGLERAVGAVNAMAPVAEADTTQGFHRAWAANRARILRLAGKERDSMAAYEAAIAALERHADTEAAIATRIEAGASGEAHAAIVAALADGQRPLDPIAVLEAFSSGQLTLASPLFAGSSFATPPEMTGPDGIFPIIYWKAFTWNEPRPIYILDEKAVCNFVVAPRAVTITGTGTADAEARGRVATQVLEGCEAIRRALDAMPRTDRVLDGRTTSVLDIEPVYKEWKTAIMPDLAGWVAGAVPTG